MSEPSGVEWAFPLQLRAMLAASAAFRTWIGAADVSAASARIGLQQVNNPDQRETGDKYGFIDVNDVALAGTRDSTGVGIGAFRLTSMMAAWGLEWRVDAFTPESTVEFLNLASTVLDEILSQAAARVIIDFARWDTKTYPLKRYDGPVCRYQVAYTMHAQQGT